MKEKPAELVSTGGYIAIPVVLAARLARIPVTLIELNAEPGKATQFLARFAQTLCICFKQTALFFTQKTELIDYPIRFSDKPACPERTRRTLGIDTTKKVLLILGGSQGSQALNTLCIDALKQSNASDQLHIIHQTGTEHIQTMKEWYKQHALSATVFAYHHDLAPYYAIADKIISRAGAGALFELIHFQKQALIIPLETASTYHQLTNAYACAANHPHLIKVVRQHEGALQALITTIQSLVQQPIPLAEDYYYLPNRPYQSDVK